MQNKKRAAKKSHGPETVKKIQTQNRYEILREPQEVRNPIILTSIQSQPKKPKEAYESKVRDSHDTLKPSQGKYPNPKNTFQEENKKLKEDTSNTQRTRDEDMDLGGLDLVGIETTCSNKALERIFPQQITLLEKAIIKAKAMKSLGVSVESLKDPEGKKEAKKETHGMHSNVQRIQMIGSQLVASGQYPTIDAALSPTNK